MDERIDEQTGTASGPGITLNYDAFGMARAAKQSTKDKLQEEVGRILMLPDEIRLHESLLAGLLESKNLVNNSIEEIERTVRNNVASETITEADSKGELKTKSRYTNQDMRDAETATRLRDNLAYQELKTKAMNVQRQMNDEQIELSYLQNKFKSIRTMVAFAAARVGGVEF